MKEITFKFNDDDQIVNVVQVWDEPGVSHFEADGVIIPWAPTGFARTHTNTAFKMDLWVTVKEERLSQAYVEDLTKILEKEIRRKQKELDKLKSGKRP